MKIKLGHLRQIIREELARAHGSIVSESYQKKWYGSSMPRVAEPGVRYGAEGAANDAAYKQMVDGLAAIGITDPQVIKYISYNYSYVTRIGEYYEKVGSVILAMLLDLALAENQKELGEQLKAKGLSAENTKMINANELIKLVKPLKQLTGAVLMDAFEVIDKANEYYHNDAASNAQRAGQGAAMDAYERRTGKSSTWGT